MTQTWRKSSLHHGYRLGYSLLKKGWLLVIFIGLVSISVELVEHLQASELGLDPEFFLEVFIHGFVLPALGGLLFTRLVSAGIAQLEFEDRISWQKNLSELLDGATTHGELVQAIVEFPLSVLPLIGSVLWLYDPETGRFELASARGFDRTKPLNPGQCPSPQVCQACISKEAQRAPGLAICDCPQAFCPNSQDNLLICLALTHADRPVGLLHLYLQEQAGLAEYQKEYLSAASLQIALALEEDKFKNLSDVHNQAKLTERQRIARQLHDTLGQDLAFVRQKLEQLTEDADPARVVSLRLELIRMKNIVEGAYESMRDTLVDLHSEKASDLSSALEKYAQAIGERAGLDILFQSDGDPISLPALVQNQLFYIFREILANIEKHSGAQRVQIQIIWVQSGLTLVVSDDGCGFDIVKTEKPGHYGLKIIQERAKQIHARLSIKSGPDLGTRVSLWLELQPPDTEIGGNPAEEALDLSRTLPIHENIVG